MTYNRLQLRHRFIIVFDSLFVAYASMMLAGFVASNLTHSRLPTNWLLQPTPMDLIDWALDLTPGHFGGVYLVALPPVPGLLCPGLLGLLIWTFVTYRYCYVRAGLGWWVTGRQSITVVGDKRARWVATAIFWLTPFGGWLLPLTVPGLSRVYGYVHLTAPRDDQAPNGLEGRGDSEGDKSVG